MYIQRGNVSFYPTAAGKYTHIYMGLNEMLIIKTINNKVLLYSTEIYTQYPIINHNGKEYKKKNVYICITESLCCTPETDTTL